MITFYNETRNKWTLTDINDSLCRLSTQRPKKDLKILHGISLSKEITLCNNINNFNNMENCVTISTDDTELGFRAIDLKPWIRRRSKYNTDIIIVDIPLSGRIIVNVFDTNILNWKIINGELLAEFSPKYNKSTGSYTKPIITLYDKKLDKLISYEFERADDRRYNLTVIYDDIYNNEPINPYKLQLFKYTKPTKLMFVYEDDVEDLNKLVYKMDRNNVQVIKKDCSNIDSVLKDVIGQRYKAATIFINSNDTKNINKKDKLYNAVMESFRTVNAVFNNSYVLSCK